MKIALFHNLPSGGAKRHTFEQVRELARRGHHIVEFAPSTADLSFASFEPFIQGRRYFELEVHPFSERRIPFLMPYVHAWQLRANLNKTKQLNRRIAREIDFSDFDIVLAKDCHIVNNPYVLRFVQTASVFQCHHGLRHRLALDVGEPGSYTSASERIKRLYYWPVTFYKERLLFEAELRNVQSASLVLTNSRYAQELIGSIYRVDAEVIYPGIDADKFRPLGMEKLGYVLTVGALNVTKGQRFLLESIAHIPRKRRPALFIAANAIDSHELRYVRQMAQELQIELHVESISDDRRMVEVYNQASIFAYAPYGEALGMAPLESLACGTPVVAVAEAGVREALREGDGSLLVERDAAMMAESLERLIYNEKLQHELTGMGRNYVEQYWTWQEAGQRLEEALLSAAGN